MNQKASFAIFIGLVMVLSAFTGIVMFFLPDKSQVEAAAGPASPGDFGIGGRVIELGFSSLDDVLSVSPENTTMAFWVDMERSQNLTATAQSVMPMAYGLNAGDQIYGQRVQRFATAYFNNSWAEFHQITPFRVAYDSLVIPHEGYMIVPLPQSTELSLVFGTPTLFGPTEAVKEVVDVIAGTSLPAGRFTLAFDEVADMQYAALEGGDYDQVYIGVTQESDSSYGILAEFENPGAGTEAKISDLSADYGLAASAEGETLVLTGVVGEEDLAAVLAALMGP